jgi:hypothetical protein
MSSSRKSPHVLVASQYERTLRFPVKLLVGDQIIETTALIDSGATGNFLDLGLLSLANFPLQRLPKPIQAYNVDGSTNRKGTILWKTKIPVLPFQKNNGLELMIVSLGRRQIILGMPWLKAQNLTLTGKQTHCHFLLHQELMILLPPNDTFSAG